MSYKNGNKPKINEIKNCPDYLFSDNLIVNIKDFDSNLLEINKLLFKSVFSVSLHYIKYIPTKSPNRVSIDRTDNDEDFLNLFCDDLDDLDSLNNEIKYLVFYSTDKIKKTLNNYKKLWEETKKQIEVTNDDETMEYRKDLMKINIESDDDLPLVKTFNILDMIVVVASALEKIVNIIHNLF